MDFSWHRVGAGGFGASTSKAPSEDSRKLISTRCPRTRTANMKMKQAVVIKMSLFIIKSAFYHPDGC
jgi:hypothetical protein